MKLYIAIWKDHHSDITAHPFSDKEKAVEWARGKAKEYARESSDYEEEQIDGWEFYACYSGEGDCIYVVEAKVDKEI
ncbi:MAG: hypothetical protein GY943_05260 [Chloroflexi bacterium]|nr:hypothetical protein [Chloroflexota bacterium]